MTLEVVCERAEALTPRERQVVALLMLEGPPDTVIAERLVVSPATVHYHLNSVYRKLGVSNRTAVVAYAWQNGIVLSDGFWHPFASR